MSETPNPPVPEDDDQDAGSAQPDAHPGAEVGMSDDEGSTFEPEEDPKP
jgi:hypothetical protein